MWAKSACVLLVWGTLLTLLMVWAGRGGFTPRAPAKIRSARSTTQVTLVGSRNPAAPLVTAAGPAPRHVIQPGDALSGNKRRLSPLAQAKPKALAGVPMWLRTIGIGAGLFIAAALVVELIVMILRRRRRSAARHAVLPTARAGPEPAAGPAGGSEDDRIVLADHDRLIVLHDQASGTVFVLRPPGADPREILRVARLVLTEAFYRELAERLGVPADGPMEQEMD